MHKWAEGEKAGRVDDKSYELEIEHGMNALIRSNGSSSRIISRLYPGEKLDADVL
jgi:hypothetical protein